MNLPTIVSEKLHNLYTIQDDFVHFYKVFFNYLQKS